MDLQTKKIGIWGFGVVGKSAINYLHPRTHTVQLLESKPLTHDDMRYLSEKNVSYKTQHDHLMEFLETNDYILASPGIDITPYTGYRHKFICELDLFCAEYTKPIIAITGTIGKTSITHLLGQLLNASGTQTAVGGNIGTAMFDLLSHESDQALLELSSFQLEQSTTLAPKLAIITNFYPNHLDRHPTADHYFEAKYRIAALQHENQHTIVPMALLEKLYTTHVLRSACTFISPQKPTNQDISRLRKRDSLCFIDNEAVTLYTNGVFQELIKCTELPTLSYYENWLIICASLHHLNIPLTIIQQQHSALSVPEHRLEKVAVIRGVDIYNDSKSTTPQATLAAIERLNGRPIHLFLGGISKGIDRSPLIAALKDKTYHIYCFGKEADSLHTLCKKESIESSAYTTLDAAVSACTQNMRPGDLIIFSPAGASYDLFEHYVQRGNYFKKLIAQIE